MSYQDTLPNYGAIWRIGGGWSVFAAYGKGFSLPNIGIPLRNVNLPGQSVAGILDLQAIIVDNKEVGFAWKGQSGSLSGSYYDANSDFGVTLTVDPITRDFVMQRRPVETKGFELSGEYILSKEFKFSALYSRIRGKTSNTVGGPQIREMSEGSHHQRVVWLCAESFESLRRLHRRAAVFRLRADGVVLRSLVGGSLTVDARHQLGGHRTG